MSLLSLSYSLEFALKYHMKKYNGWDECERQVITDLCNSNIACILSIKGRNFYYKHNYRDAIRLRLRDGKETRILLQSPNSLHVNEKVSAEFGWKDLETYRNDLIHSIDLLSEEVKAYGNRDSTLKLFGSKPAIRLYIFDE